MCRLSCFPPGTPKEKAIEILKNFAEGNGDGVGSVHVKDGKFVVNKWAVPLEQALREKMPLLDHMPHRGWTLVHLRAASHGSIAYRNTHPFIKGDWAFMHNGVFGAHSIMRAALAPYTTFEGETDSEVVAHLFATLGPQKFIKRIEQGGVYLALNKNGTLYAINTSFGDLTLRYTKYGVMLASELPDYYKKFTNVGEGWIKLTSGGSIERSKFEKDTFSSTKGYAYAYMDSFPSDDSEYKRLKTKGIHAIWKDKGRIVMDD